MSSTAFSRGNFESCYAHLLELRPPLLPPSKPTDPSLTDAISSLYVHPALEAALHLLNNDLPSTHFLVRHMEAPPAYEAMYLHGILHRIEGDYDNARAWYRDVQSSEVFRSNWQRIDNALGFIDQVERLVKQKNGSEKELEVRSVEEIKGVVDFVVKKFGSGKHGDARSAWVQSEGENKKLGQEMVSGDRGFRKF